MKLNFQPLAGRHGEFKPKELLLQMRLRHLSSFCKCFKHARHTERALRSFPSAPHAHGLKRHSGTLGKSILCGRMVSSATSKPTDVDLVEASVGEILAGRSLLNLVDIGINLADSSYDKVQFAKLQFAALEWEYPDIC